MSYSKEQKFAADDIKSEQPLGMTGKFSEELGQQMALRERQFAAITNLVRVTELMPAVLPLLQQDSREDFSTLTQALRIDHVLKPAIEGLAMLRSNKMLEDATRLTIAGAVILAHSIFEDLLHSAADLSFRANPAWWKDTVIAFSTSTFSLDELNQKGFDQIYASEAESFMRRWQNKSLVNKLDSFLRVHKPSKTFYKADVCLDRGTLVSIDKLRHKIVHKDVFSEVDDEIVNKIFGTINSGRFIHRLLGEPEWIGIDMEAFLAKSSIMTGISDEAINAVATEITPEHLKQVFDRITGKDS